MATHVDANNKIEINLSEDKAFLLHRSPYESVSAGWEKWPFRALFLASQSVSESVNE